MILVGFLSSKLNTTILPSSPPVTNSGKLGLVAKHVQEQLIESF